MAGKKGMKQYSKEIKKKAIKLYLEEGMSTKEINKKLEIKDPNRIYNWVIEYRKEGEKVFEKKPRGRKKKQEESIEEKIARLEMENEILKKFHAELRKDLLEKRNIGLSKKIKKSMK